MPDVVTVSFASLIAQPTIDELVTLELGILKDGKFPVDDWDVTNPFSVMVSANCTGLLSLAALIPPVAKGGFLGLAKGDWLTLLAQSNFEEERALASIAIREIRITDTGGGGGSFSADSITIKSNTGLIFTLNELAVVPSGGHVDAAFRAERPGSAYNGSFSSYSLVTSIPGLGVADAPAGVTVPGLDQESDDALETACSDKWSTLGRGATDDAYEYIATHVDGLAAGTITRVTVLRRTPLPGQVTIYAAGPTSAGPVDGADALSGTIVTTMQNFIDPAGHNGARAPNCVDVFVVTAKYKKIALVGTVSVVATEAVAAQSAAQTALNAFASGYPIGGGLTAAPVDRERIIAKIAGALSDDPRNNVTLSSPAADVALAANEIPYFDFTGLSWVEV